MRPLNVNLTRFAEIVDELEPLVLTDADLSNVKFFLHKILQVYLLHSTWLIFLLYSLIYVRLHLPSKRVTNAANSAIRPSDHM